MIKIMDETCDSGHEVYLMSDKKTGTGILILIVGLFLTPALIGIPIAIWGFSTIKKEIYYIFCPTCGSKCEITSAQYYYLISSGGYMYSK